MRKVLAFLVLLMLPWTARGQALAEWYYWFDADDKPYEVGTVTNQHFQLQADVSHLNRGFHTLFVQVKDTAGIYSTPYSRMFYNMPESENRLLKFRYWFDSNGALNEQSYDNGHYLLDVSHLHPGFHFLNYYLYDETGAMTDIHSAGFYCSPIPSRQKLYYWLSGDSVATQIPDFSGDVVLDVTRANEGFNTIFFLMEDNGLSTTQSYKFIKVPQTENAGDMTLVCIIDGKVVGEKKVSAHGGMVKCEMDVSDIPTGVHKAMFQLITPSGVGSSIAETYFIRTLTNNEVASMQCSYTIDGYLHRIEKGTCSNGTFHFDLPVDEIEEGLHRIDYMLVAENGTTTTQGNAWFFKTPLGGNNIAQYDYWLNDKSDEVQSVTLDEPTDPFKLVKLLPVPSEPIRSSCFHFEVKDGKPMMYAKNDIHFRFHDKSGRWVDESKQYVDYNVSEEIKDIADLQSTQTFARLNDNDIKWFKFEAEYGDSIAVMSSQATTMQIFDSAGKLLYNTNGKGSVEYGGCHLFEDDTYYLAVHDVKGSEQSMTVDCKRINKFDVFEFTPTRMSSMGSTTIDIKGNGLEFAKSVSLTNEEITLLPDTIVANSSELLARFALAENYDVKKDFDLNVFFHNAERNESKNLCMKNSIHLEPMNRGDISVDIVTEHRVGDPFPVKVTVKNNGNVGYYGIPFNIAYDNIRKIDELVFVNFGIQISQDAYTKNDFWAVTDNIVGTGVEGLYLPTYLPYLGPYEEYTYVFGLKTKHAHTRLNFYAWTGEPWYDGVSIGNASANNAEMKAKGTRCVPSNIPDVYDALDAMDAAADLARVPLVGDATTVGTNAVLTGEAIGGIIQGLSAMQNNAMVEAGYVPMGSDINDFAFPYRHCPRSPMDMIETFLNNINPLHSKGTAIPIATASSGRSIKDYASGDCPKPNPHPTDVWIPGDPNEITGYVSEAGSKFLMDTVQVVSYDIEFENDPKIANSSAHVISIENKLDASKFDLSSFSPKDITLSGRRVELDGSPSFVKTIDLRPQIDAIAELRCEYNSTEGLAKWTLTSLDPMTMEQTDDIMQGILPVNYDGKSGVGNVTYSVKLKQQFADGTEIPNKASIIFDNNDPIMTPTWTNIIDAVAPVSKATDVALKNDTTAIIRFEGSDERSGVWKYEVYAQQGVDAPWIMIAEVPADSSFVEYRIYDDIDYGYCTLAVDSAGNVEDKALRREIGAITYILGDADGDGYVTKADANLVVDCFLGKKTKYINEKAADMNGDGKITMSDANAIVNKYLGSE